MIENIAEKALFAILNYIDTDGIDESIYSIDGLYNNSIISDSDVNSKDLIDWYRKKCKEEANIRELIREQALAKLTDEEKEVLGFT